MALNRRCVTCRWWTPDSVNPEIGICRREPPVVPGKHDGDPWLHPVTRATDGDCYEFESDET